MRRPIFSPKGSVNQMSGFETSLRTDIPWGRPPAVMIGYSKNTFVPGTYLPILSLLNSVNHTLTSRGGVVVESSRTSSRGCESAVGMANVTYSPLTGLSRPMLFLLLSVTHTNPSGSTAIPQGLLSAVISKCLKSAVPLSSSLIDPILFPSCSVHHTE